MKESDDSIDCIHQFDILILQLLKEEDKTNAIVEINNFFVRSLPKEKLTMFNYLLGKVYHE